MKVLLNLGLCLLALSPAQLSVRPPLSGLGGVLNARQYLHGGHDICAAVNSAITALKSRWNGGRIEIPAMRTSSRLTCGTSIVLPSNIIIQGQGPEATTLFVHGRYPVFVFRDSAAYDTVRDLSIYYDCGGPCVDVNDRAFAFTDHVRGDGGIPYDDQIINVRVWYAYYAVSDSDCAACSPPLYGTNAWNIRINQLYMFGNFIGVGRQFTGAQWSIMNSTAQNWRSCAFCMQNTNMLYMADDAAIGGTGDTPGNTAWFAQGTAVIDAPDCELNTFSGNQAGCFLFGGGSYTLDAPMTEDNHFQDHSAGAAYQFEIGSNSGNAFVNVLSPSLESGNDGGSCLETGSGTLHFYNYWMQGPHSIAWIFGNGFIASPPVGRGCSVRRQFGHVRIVVVRPAFSQAPVKLASH